MTMWLCRTSALLLPLLLAASAAAAPQGFDLGAYGAPPVASSGKPLICTVTYLVEDFTSNETYATRMQFTPGANAAVNAAGRMSCPIMTPPSVSQAALDGCASHAARRSDCVFADMSRGFDDSPNVVNSSDNGARCQSDQASRIAIACVREGKLDVCNVGCGQTADDAIRAAQARCEAKHRKACAITASVPVEAP